MPELVTSPDKIVTDQLLLDELVKQRIDKDYVELFQDYALGGKEHSPYGKFYRDKVTSRQFGVFSGLPMVNYNGDKVVASWGVNGKYLSRTNQFAASVLNTGETLLKCLNDQPDGRKSGDELYFHPQLFLGTQEIIPSKVSLLPFDPINANYANNVLEWDYGICKRILRLVEGRIHGYWVFTATPTKTIRIKYNQSGAFNLKLGEFAVSDDKEEIPVDAWQSLQFPVMIGDSQVFHPDADTETVTVDGVASRQTAGDWATIIAGAGTNAADGETSIYPVAIVSGASDPLWLRVYRGIMLFNAASIPDDAVKVSGKVSVLGSNDVIDEGSIAPDINLYGSTPATNTAVIAADYSQVGSTPFSTAITYAGFSAAGWNHWVLNPDGLTAVSLTTVSKFGFRNANYDVAAQAPAWSGASRWARVGIWTAEKGTGYKPKLVVTYSEPNRAVNGWLRGTYKMTRGGS